MNDFKVCKVCGFLLDDDEDFCPMCGWTNRHANFKLIKFLKSK